LDEITANVARYIEKKRINLAALARDTGIPYSALYGSLSNKKRDRELRAKELVKICKFLDVDPMDFADVPDSKDAG
jgi:DNA-binding Xre family transcriptional regulator